MFADNQSRIVIPIACGKMHLQAWGVDGFSDPTHWCCLARNILYASPTVPLVQPPAPVLVEPPAAVNVGLVGYWTTWSGTNLLSVSPKYTVINLAFANPQMKYQGGSTFGGDSGLSYPGGPSAFKKDVGTMQSRRVRVMLSVGGGTAGNWDGNFDAGAIARFVGDFGLDGVDIDLERNDSWSSSKACADALVKVAQALRQALGKTKLISAALFMTGIATGNCVPVLKSGCLDFVNVMTYDSDTGGDWENVLRQYRSVFSGPVALGLEPPVEGYGSHRLTKEEVLRVKKLRETQSNVGIMIWCIGKADSSPTERDVIGWL